MDRLNGGVFVLPPHEREDGTTWYRGTADAIFRNLKFIDQYDPEHVLILSGDHIYKMDYDRMLAYHKEKDADCTISVIEVSLDEAKRFGMVNTDENYRIFEFEEKPAHPKSTTASMGVYLFRWKLLRSYLLQNADLPDTSHDFGNDILPRMLADGKTLYAYPFEGYWKDVGTIESLWEANMDLLSEQSKLDLNDPLWRIYTRNPNQPAEYISPNGVVRNSMINEGCTVCGEVEHSVLFMAWRWGRQRHYRFRHHAQGTHRQPCSHTPGDRDRGHGHSRSCPDRSAAGRSIPDCACKRS